jgi:hypothetical protein
MAQGPWDTGTWDAALWDSLPITGNAATGSPGSVGGGARTVALTGNAATGAAGNVIYVPAPIVVDDTHDGDYHKKLKKRFNKEDQRLKQKRKDIVAAYERIVEGKPDIADEIAKPFIVTDLKKTENGKPKIDYDRMFADLNKIERIWAEYLEMDDEDMLVLL